MTHDPFALIVMFMLAWLVSKIMTDGGGGGATV